VFIKDFTNQVGVLHVDTLVDIDTKWKTLLNIFGNEVKRILNIQQTKMIPGLLLMNLSASYKFYNTRYSDECLFGLKNKVL
jgi:hypothetical protein